ncbi:M15 family metallopeptidase [Nocardioides sp.]|uniref:M15 family metallopeptidase n=1 Tax=Nocardioides sp. TaxID=35761 RepID=UPI0039E38F3B
MGLRHGSAGRGALAAIAACLALAACQSDPVAESPAATGTTTTTSAPASTATPTVADPAHAVPPPGPRQGALVPADILVLAQSTISDEVLQQVQATPGVTGAVKVSMANVSVEDRLVNLVAADPASYRLFTSFRTADNQEVWDRVAGGEVAVAAGLQQQLGVDDQGFVQLGAGTDAPKVHVGAWADQIDGAVDAVVNPKWGEALGIPEGNALLITTTSTAPDRVVRPLRKVVGKDASIQRLDVVAREGLDIDAVQSPVLVGTLAQVVGHYTYTVSGGRVVPDPAWVKANIATEVVPILGAVTCNKAFFPQLKAALQEVVERGLADKIYQYGGCYNPRFIAGSHSLSNHAFGLAIDLNVPDNGRGIPGAMDRQVVAIFEKWGFTWGGRWRYTDPMHFEMNRLVHPG